MEFRLNPNNHYTSQVLDMEFIDNVTRGKVAMKINLIKAFLEQTPIIIQELEESVGSYNEQEVKNVAHKAKSSVQVMGMNNTVDALSSLESMEISRANKEMAHEKFNEIKSLCSQAYEELKRMLLVL